MAVQTRQMQKVTNSEKSMSLEDGTVGCHNDKATQEAMQRPNTNEIHTLYILLSFPPLPAPLVLWGRNLRWS